MERDDLRVLDCDDPGPHDSGYCLKPVTDADLASLGYVKADDPQVIAEWTITDEVDEADLLRQGYVKRPVCEPCMGTGGTRVPCMRCKNGESEHSHQCPSCGGTGFGPLVALDGAHRIKMCSQSGERMWGNKCAHPDDDPCEPMYVWFIRELADRVLAAIDQEDTDAD